MKKAAVSFLLLASMVGLVFSQTVNLCGLVTDPGGKPLTNTLVRLGQTRFTDAYGNEPYYTTTDANGHYQLGSGNCNVGVIPRSTLLSGDAFLKPIYIGGKVLFSVPQDNAWVKMSMYDLAGRFVRDVMNSPQSKGNYSVSVDSRGISSQFYMLRVTINGTSTAMLLQPQTRAAAGSAALNAPEFQARLEKLAAVVDTLHATEPGYSLGVTTIQALSGQYDFTLTKNNTFNGDTDAFWDTAHAKKEVGHFWYTVLNRTNGAFPDSMIYLAIGDGGVPFRLSDQNTIDFTTSASGRLYIMVGYKPATSGGYRPANQVWDFEEHTNGGGKFHGNTTRVDAFGTPIAYRVHCLDGFDTCRGEVPHVYYQTRQSFFDEFKNEVPGEWTHLATVKAPYRIPNPGGDNNSGGFGAGGTYVNYWGSYGPNPYNADLGPQPSAASNRHVIGLTDAQQADWNYHYKSTPCNFYSYFLHRRAYDKKCYGFPYDDYANWSSYISTDYHSSVSWLILAVGY
jgi:Beta-1,3-glucanase